MGGCGLLIRLEDVDIYTGPGAVPVGRFGLREITVLSLGGFEESRANTSAAAGKEG